MRMGNGFRRLVPGLKVKPPDSLNPKKQLQAHERHAIKFLLQHLAVGATGGFVFGGLLLLFDIGGLRTLAFNSSDTGVVLFMLFFGLFITFGSAGMGVGVMSLGEEKS